MGCGRVGSSLARSLEKRGHTVAVIDMEADSFRRLGPDFAGKTIRGVGFDREVLLEAGIEQADGVRRGVLRRQLQHLVRAGGPRDLRRGERGGPDLRPRPGRGLRAARHPHRGHRALDRRPGAPPAAAGRLRAAVAGPVGFGAADGGARRPRLGGPHVGPDRGGTDARVPFIFRMGSGIVPKQSTIFQDGDLLYAAVLGRRAGQGRGRPRRTAAESRNERGGSGSDAGSHRRGRQRRPLDRRRADRERPRGPADRQGPARDQGRDASTTPTGCWPTPASSPRWRRPAWTPATWRSPRPGTTRPTW